MEIGMIAAKIDPETFLYVQLSDVLDDWAMLYKTFSGPFTGIRDLLAKLVLISTFSTCIFTEFFLRYKCTSSWHRSYATFRVFLSFRKLNQCWFKWIVCFGVSVYDQFLEVTQSSSSDLIFVLPPYCTDLHPLKYNKKNKRFFYNKQKRSVYSHPYLSTNKTTNIRVLRLPTSHTN